MKVAFLLLRFPVPSETFVLGQIRGLIDAGIDVRILTFEMGDDWNGISEPLQADLRARTTMIGPARGRPLKAAIFQLAVATLLRTAARRRIIEIVDLWRNGHRAAAKSIASWPIGRPALAFDAILAHFGPAGIRAMQLRRAGVLEGPIATAFHGYDVSRSDVVAACLDSYRELFRNIELLLPVSEYWAERLRGWGAPPEQLRILRMGVDLPPSIAAPAYVPSRPLKVVAVGRFTEKKGLAFAIEAIRRCKAPAELSLIGYGKLESELARVAAEPGTNPVNFLGKLPHRVVLDRIGRCDVFVQPSVTAGDGDMEGVPVALMEAMARGRIVIATKHSGIPELVEDGVSGILVPERDPQAIAAALENVAGGMIDAPSMGAAAQTAVADRFDKRRLDLALIAILQDLAGKAMFETSESKGYGDAQRPGPATSGFGPIKRLFG